MEVSPKQPSRKASQDFQQLSSARFGRNAVTPEPANEYGLMDRNMADFVT